MKTIQPVSTWYNGQEQEATVLNVYCSGDNLLDAASFNYQLLMQGDVTSMNNGLIPLVSGGLSMTGQTYLDWQTNDYAYDWVASQLNLTITGEYVPPTTEG